ncbi:MAG: tetratricopeptide repeat protein, partial [Desulfobacterales bacterium]|nr:tetratricopeptide repeat protein [Desulfobacterales bacterium]
IDAYNQLGTTLARLERYPEAITTYKQALQLCPEAAEILNNLGIAQRESGQIEAAIDSYRQALALLPEFPEAYHNLAHAETDLERYEQAEAHAREAIQLAPDYAEAYNQLGITLNAAGRSQEAITHYHKALELQNDSAEFYNNLAIAQKQTEQWDPSEQNYRKALSLAPETSIFHTNLANLLKERGRCDEALHHYHHAIEREPDNADARWNRALCHLLNGDFEAGWQDYRWRNQAPLETQLYLHQYRKPQWQGQDFSGQRLLIHSEQGLGDTLQFIRYLPLVKARGGTVILETWSELQSLLQTIPGIDEIVATTTQPYPEERYDLYTSIMDLPGLFDCNLTNLPSHVPYITADVGLTKVWQKRFDPSTLNIGLVWAGRPTHGNDKNRSCQLRHFIPLLQQPGL